MSAVLVLHEKYQPQVNLPRDLEATPAEYTSGGSTSLTAVSLRGIRDRGAIPAQFPSQPTLLLSLPLLPIVLSATIYCTGHQIRTSRRLLEGVFLASILQVHGVALARASFRTYHINVRNNLM